MSLVDALRKLYHSTCPTCGHRAIRTTLEGKTVCDWCHVTKSQRFWHFDAEGNLIIDPTHGPGADTDARP